jgi:hypothetical protein
VSSPLASAGTPAAVVVALTWYSVGVPKPGEITKPVVAVAPSVALWMTIFPIGVKRLVNVQIVPDAGTLTSTGRWVTSLVPQKTDSSDQLPSSLVLWCSVIRYVPGLRSGSSDPAAIPSSTVMTFAELVDPPAVGATSKSNVPTAPRVTFRMISEPGVRTVLLNVHVTTSPAANCTDTDGSVSLAGTVLVPFALEQVTFVKSAPTGGALSRNDQVVPPAR